MTCFYLILLTNSCIFVGTIENEPILGESRVSIPNGDASSVHLKRRSLASKNGSIDGVGEALDAENMSNGSRSTLNKSDLSKPLARKDVFYSGSITNLREFQSQKSLSSYRQSVISLPHAKTNQQNEDSQSVSQSKGKLHLLSPRSTTFYRNPSLFHHPTLSNHLESPTELSRSRKLQPS